MTTPAADYPFIINTFVARYHIKNGLPRSPTLCPTALAIKAELRRQEIPFTNLRVNRISAMMTVAGRHYEAVIFDRLWEFNQLFNQGELVQPIKISLRFYEQVQTEV